MLKATLFIFVTLASSYYTYQAALLAKDVEQDCIAIIEKEKQENKEEIMSIKIPKLYIDNKIFNFESSLNNIDKNVIILKGSSMPDKNGVLLIGAHSGTGKYAYFKNLNKININDVVEIKYNNKIYKYKVVKKYLDEKDGSISFNNSNNSRKLILYTCNPNDKKNFLVVVCEPI